MQGQPRVVEAKAKEGQQKVELLVDLGLGVPNVELKVAVAVVTSFVEEGIHFLSPDLVQPIRSEGIGRSIIIHHLPILWRTPGGKRV